MKMMMKELNKLITKDIFNCLSEVDAGRLRELRAELHIDDEAYRRMKKMITSREIHDRVMEARKKPNRMVNIIRYAAILILPVAVVTYIIISLGNAIKLEVVVQNQVEEKLSAPVRKQPILVLEDGAILQLQRVKGEKEITSNAVSNGDELIYSKRDSLKNIEKMEYNTVIVPQGGEYHVVLADGTKVWLNEETQLKFPVNFVGDTREVFLREGEIYLEVVRDEKHPFIVHTEKGDIQVLGTEFNVKCLQDRKMATTLVKGSVQVKTEEGEVILKPNQQAEVGDMLNVITIADVEEIICWKDNMFFFKDVELEKILDKLGEWYGFTVFYENAEVKQERFFVRVDKYAEINKILDVISDVSNVKFKINGKTVSVYK